MRDRCIACALRNKFERRRLHRLEPIRIKGLRVPPDARMLIGALQIEQDPRALVERVAMPGDSLLQLACSCVFRPKQDRADQYPAMLAPKLPPARAANSIVLYQIASLLTGGALSGGTDARGHLR